MGFLLGGSCSPCCGGGDGPDCDSKCDVEINVRECSDIVVDFGSEFSGSTLYIEFIKPAGQTKGLCLSSGTIENEATGELIYTFPQSPQLKTNVILNGKKFTKLRFRFGEWTERAPLSSCPGSQKLSYDLVMKVSCVAPNCDFVSYAERCFVNVNAGDWYEDWTHPASGGRYQALGRGGEIAGEYELTLKSRGWVGGTFSEEWEYTHPDDVISLEVLVQCAGDSPTVTTNMVLQYQTQVDYNESSTLLPGQPPLNKCPTVAFSRTLFTKTYSQTVRRFGVPITNVELAAGPIVGTWEDRDRVPPFSTTRWIEGPDFCTSFIGQTQLSPAIPDFGTNDIEATTRFE